jgi:UDP-GlcNAc:undecaprenyl-phosphate GlcNAc-1-phosphate transferase
MGGFVSKEFWGLIVGGIIITVVGFLDDIYQLSPKIRIFFQLLAALIVVFSGTTIEWVSWPWANAGLVNVGSIGSFITVIWIVGLTNAVNFIDGLDGLATGVASIASLSFMVISFIFGPPVIVVLAAALAGSCLGFLPHNFNPAKIFMGDTGSTFLGFTLAVISIQGLTKSYTMVTVIVGAIVLGLPIFDTSFAIIRRLSKRQSIYLGDRGHLHHRLVDKGISHKKAVLTMYAVSGCFGIAGILFALKDFFLATLIIVVIFVVWLGDIVYTSYRKRKIKNE